MTANGLIHSGMPRIPLICIAVLLCMSVIMVPVAAEATTQNYAADADSYIRWGTDYADSNFGTATTFVTRIENLDGSYWGRSLIHFDLSTIPEGSTIESATLHAYKTAYTSTPDVYAYRITTPWTETGVTWNSWDSNTSISSAGPTAVATTTAAKEWLSWDVTTDVQAYVGGTASNYGWMLNVSDTTRPSSTLKAQFYSREYSANNPYLTVVYSTSNLPTASFSGTPVSGTSPLAVQFTDASTSTDTGTAERVTNGGFESGSTGWTAGDSIWTVQSGTVHGGTYAEYYEISGSIPGDQPALSQTIDLTRVNNISFWYYLAEGEGPNPTLKAAIDSTVAGSYTTLGSWVHVILDTTSYTGTHTIAFYANDDQGSGSIYLDDVTATGTNGITAWSWNFGDGDSTNATVQNPVHTYLSAGTYDVTLTVTDSNGSDSETKEDYITVSAPVVAPVAAFGANVTSGTVPLAVQFTDASSNTPTSWVWDFGDGSTGMEENPVHTYAAAGTYTVNLTATNSAGSDSEEKTGYITVTEIVSNINLTFTGANGPATVNPYPAYVFARETNTVQIKTIKNTGTEAATNIVVALYASDVSSTVPVNSTTIASLAAGTTASTISLIDPTIRATAEGSVTYTAVIDPDNLITEMNETDNTRTSAAKTVLYNGYKGKGIYWAGGSNITTEHTYDLNGNVIYATQSASYYKAVGWTTRTETWMATDLPVPATATVQKAYLYISYNWDTTSGGVPTVTTTFNGNTIPLGTPYTDKSNFGAYADYKYGLYPAVDVTSLFVANGDNTLVMTPNSGNSNALYPSTLVVIYSDPTESRKQIFINEECDELLLSESSYATTLNEVIAYSPFSGMTINTATVQNATLHSFAGSAGPGEGNLIFNGQTVATNAWQGTSSTGSAQSFDVKNYLAATDNIAGIQGTTSGGMDALQQILVVEYPVTTTVPVAAFGANVTSGSVPLTIQFTDASTNFPIDWTWDFGDGSTSTEQSPVHEYTVAGTYTVNLTVTNSAGTDSEEKTNYITAGNTTAGPVAAFSGTPTSGNAPLQVQFTDASSGTVTGWSWDFNNDGIEDSTVQNPSYTYSTVGAYTVNLTVTGPDGVDSETKTNYITVGALSAPIAAFSGTPTSGTAPLQVQFTDASSGTVTGWSWDFNNDGTIDSNSQSPQYTYGTEGTYTVSLTVANAAGSSTETKAGYITVTPEVFVPVADFSANTTSGAAPLTVLFSDASTNSPTSWSWNFGDGSTSTEQSPVHEYTTTGIYTVTLTAANSAGSNTYIRTSYITVTAAVVTLPDQTGAPIDPDNDSLYEDLNANGVGDLNDVVLFFKNIDWIVANEPVSAFDYNGNSAIDLNDIVLLYKEILG